MAERLDTIEEKRGRYRKKLELALTKLARNKNIQIKNEYGKENLVSPDGSLNPEAFLVQNGGIYTKNELEEHNKKILKAELRFAEADKISDPDAQERKHAAWKRRKMYQEGRGVELATTLLISKILGDDFIVVRTTDYDDYFPGIDLIILNKKTGKTLCAIDNVAQGESRTKEGDVTMSTKKLEKTLNSLDEGGVELTYGLKIKNGAMTMEPLQNMPVFYFEISDKDWVDLSSDESNLESITKTELRVFGLFVKSLIQQRKDLLLATNLKPSEPAYQKVESFEKDTLAVFGEIYNRRKAELAN